MYKVKFDQIQPAEVKCDTLHGAVEVYDNAVTSGRCKNVRIEVLETRELTGDEIAAATKDRPRPSASVTETTNEA